MKSIPLASRSVCVWNLLDVFKQIKIININLLFLQVFSLDKYRKILALYCQSGSHPHIADIAEILVGPRHAYAIFNKASEDLLSYIRRKRRLSESEAAQLFSQIIATVEHCHKRGIVLRHLQLEKFTFIDKRRFVIIQILTHSCCMVLAAIMITVMCNIWICVKQMSCPSIKCHKCCQHDMVTNFNGIALIQRLCVLSVFVFLDVFAIWKLFLIPANCIIFSL